MKAMSRDDLSVTLAFTLTSPRLDFTRTVSPSSTPSSSASVELISIVSSGQTHMISLERRVNEAAVVVLAPPVGEDQRVVGNRLLGFTVEDLSCNRPMQSLFEKMGFDIEKRRVEGIYELKMRFREM